jgi:hypothetical protein
MEADPGRCSGSRCRNPRGRLHQHFQTLDEFETNVDGNYAQTT